MRQPHIGGKAAGGTIGRVLAAHNVDRGARTARKLGGSHKRATRLRHGQRHVLAGIEPGLDGLQRLGSVELRGYTVNEHAVPPASQRQKPAGASSAGRSSNSLPVMVAHGEDSSSSVRPAPQQKRQTDEPPGAIRVSYTPSLVVDTHFKQCEGRGAVTLRDADRASLSTARGCVRLNCGNELVLWQAVSALGDVGRK